MVSHFVAKKLEKPKKITRKLLSELAIIPSKSTGLKIILHPSGKFAPDTKHVRGSNLSKTFWYGNEFFFTIYQKVFQPFGMVKKFIRLENAYGADEGMRQLKLL